MHVLLSAKGVTKIFPGTIALDGVDLDLIAGEVHALLGENGAGKSTLIKCLTGVYQRDGGSVTMAGQPIDPRSTADAQALGIGTVYQEVNLLPNLTVAENLTLGRQPRRLGMIDTRAMNRMAREMLADYDLGIDVGRPLAAYSVAIQQIVAIARAVALSGKVLILDEPTASLDAREVEGLFRIVRALKDRGLAVVFISHFLDQVYAISDRITVLRNGRNVGGGLARDIDRLTLVRLMLGHDLAQVEAQARRETVGTIGGEPAVAFENFGKKGRVEPFDLTVHKGEVVGLAGLLGSGRTETAEAIFGISGHDSGAARINGAPARLDTPRDAIRAGIGFCPEDRKTDGIVAELSVRENILLAMQARRGWSRPVARAEQNRIAADYVKRLDIRTPDAEKPVGLLSGGNQQKVILARWLLMNPDFLILDEPTRGIDVGAHAEIIRVIEALCDRGMALLVISSELEELASYSHRIVVMRDRRQVAELTGADVAPDRIVQSIAAAPTVSEGAQ
ncbi:sugar ABC transporter ATP-binding protein [Paracoccus pacificus]|uniref:Sugar ABC transporter ATP-binding protein n=1 Tax=Paracoccus pacificus TaxID=1463598 RepID=A0ABW4R7T7_9RHOB